MCSYTRLLVCLAPNIAHEFFKLYLSHLYFYIYLNYAVFCWQVAQVKQMAAEVQAQLKPCWQGESGQLLCRSLVRFFFPLTVSHVHPSVFVDCAVCAN